MDFKSVAIVMAPYWLMGLGVLACAYLCGYKSAIRIEKKAVFDWIAFLILVTVFRVLFFSLFPHFGPAHEAAKNVSIIPWQLTLTVFWEDACHGLPLLLLRKLIGTKKWTWPIHGILLAAVMLEFALGHLYQGVFSAALLSLYIPASIRLGEKYGFGTVMVGHTIFDFVTIWTVKLLLGG